MLGLLPLIVAAAIGYLPQLQVEDLAGSWRAQRERTMLELHPNFTYDRHSADMIDQGYWELQRYNRIEFFYIEHGKRRIVDAYYITDFRKNVMHMRRVKGESDAWLKTKFSRHLSRLSPQ